VRWLNYLRVWLPVLLWMTVIFVASTDLGSAENTSRIIGPFLRWINPDITDATIWGFQTVFRKFGHMAGYAVLSMLVWRSLRLSRDGVNRWRWSEVPWVMLASVLYAVSDEFHQSLVATRMGTVWDVLYDATGAILGLLFIYLAGRVGRQW